MVDCSGLREQGRGGWGRRGKVVVRRERGMGRADMVEGDWDSGKRWRRGGKWEGEGAPEV